METGWQVTDLSEAFGMLVTALLFSIPFWIVRAAWASPLPTVILILTGAVGWTVVSVPGTAARMTEPAPEGHS